MSKPQEFTDQMHTYILLAGLLGMAFIPKLWKGMFTLIFIATLGVTKLE